MASWPNRDGPQGTLNAMQQAARPQSAEDDLPARVSAHDGILADHGMALDAHAGLLGAHDSRITALEGNGGGPADHNAGSPSDDGG